jgi:hypothetical protein
MPENAMNVSRLATCILLGVWLSAGAAPRTVMVSVAADSENAGYEGSNALDGDPATMWHTPWGAAETKLPHTLTIDLKGEYVLTGFRYQRRLDGVNGSIGKYAILMSSDGKAWGQPVVQGTFAKKSGDETVAFAAPMKARFVRLQALSEVGGRQWTSAAELELLSEGIQFRTRALPGARRHGGTQEAVARKRQGPDTSTLAGALEMARLTLDFVGEARARGGGRRSVAQGRVGLAATDHPLPPGARVRATAHQQAPATHIPAPDGPVSGTTQWDRRRLGGA